MVSRGSIPQVEEVLVYVAEAIRGLELDTEPELLQFCDKTLTDKELLLKGE